MEGHGTTIDVILANGVLRERDQIVISGIQVSNIANFFLSRFIHSSVQVLLSSKY